MIIGLSGYAQVGKDTIADYLVKKYNFTRVAFADPIREALYRLNPNVAISEFNRASLASAVDHMGWEEVKRASPETRILLQRLGTEVGRTMFGDDFWVNQAIQKALQYEKVVISDVRYPNELKSIIDNFGQVWRINKANVKAINRHESESALDGFLFNETIDNDGPVESLYSKVDIILNK